MRKNNQECELLFVCLFVCPSVYVLLLGFKCRVAGEGKGVAQGGSEGRVEGLECKGEVWKGMVGYMKLLLRKGM